MTGKKTKDVKVTEPSVPREITKAAEKEAKVIVNKLCPDTAWYYYWPLVEAIAAAFAEKNSEIERLRLAVEPFADAARGIPPTVSDSHPVARVTNDARSPGTITSLTAALFRSAAGTAGKPEGDGQ